MNPNEGNNKTLSFITFHINGKVCLKKAALWLISTRKMSKK